MPAWLVTLGCADVYATFAVNALYWIVWRPTLRASR